MYDVYYTTGGGPWVNAGTDTWVNLWMELVAPKLDVKPILLIHRTKPKEYGDYDFPIDAHWHGDNIEKFEELCKGARRINILHGHYTPTKPIIDNSDKIHSNVLHNSVDHIIKSQVGTDAYFGWHPFINSQWEQKVNKSSKYNIWVGVYDILTKNVNIPNFYEFKNNLDLEISNNPNGGDIYFKESNIETLRLASGNATFAGTISSGAITSSGNIAISAGNKIQSDVKRRYPR